jgi:putative transposase
MQQQARNVSIWAEEEGIDVRFLIHDRDSKFTEAFDEHFCRPDGGTVLTPYQAPIANCFIESWIGSLKRECLNQFFCFSLRQLDHILQTYASYHNQYRPHQGLGNRPLGIPEDPSWQTRDIDVGRIRCQQWLGGLLKHYYRKAA